MIYYIHLNCINHLHKSFMDNYEQLYSLINSLIKQIDITVSSSKIKLVVSTIYYRIVYNVDDCILNAWKNSIIELKIIDAKTNSSDLCDESVLCNSKAQLLYNFIIIDANTSLKKVENTIQQEGYLSLLKAYIRYNSSIGIDDISLHSKNLTVGEAIMLRQIKYD